LFVEAAVCLWSGREILVYLQVLKSLTLLSLNQQPLLDLENRVFEMTGLATAAQDADEADDNMSRNEEDMKAGTQEKLELAWKKLVNRLTGLPAKAHVKIRQIVVEAISAARKAHLLDVVAKLKTQALLQFHPDAAGQCKAGALKILEEYGGYDDADDDEDEEDEDAADDDEETNAKKDQQGETGISAVLCVDAVTLNSSLDGLEDSTRADWISTIKSTKTISKIAALTAAFVQKASEKLEKLEAEHENLMRVTEAWEKAANKRKKTSLPGSAIPEPSEVWANVHFTDEFVLAKVEEYPLWPARKCIAKDPELAASLASLDRTLVSLVGESGGLRVVKTEPLRPFSETLPVDEDLNSHPKEIRTQLDECMAMARRVIRGKEKKKTSGKGKRKSKGSDNHEFKEEKKLAT
jgi:hypothetical protein